MQDKLYILHVHMFLPCHNSAMFWRFGKELVVPESNGCWLLAWVDQLRGWNLQGGRERERERERDRERERETERER